MDDAATSDGVDAVDRFIGRLYLHLARWPAGLPDRTRARNRHAIAHGLSFKQAARRIGIAPSTVANHLYRVYRKLGVQPQRARRAGLSRQSLRVRQSLRNPAQNSTPEVSTGGLFSHVTLRYIQ